MTWITPRCFWISGTFFTISWVVRGLSLSFRALTFNCRHLENTNGLRDGSSDEMYDIRRLMKISTRLKIVLQMVGYRRHKEYHFGIGRVTRYFWGIWCSVDLPKTWCWTGLCHVVFFFFFDGLKLICSMNDKIQQVKFLAAFKYDILRHFFPLWYDTV